MNFQGQIKCARENYAALNQCLEKMQGFPLPKVFLVTIAR
jgi:hypothetical protein